MLTKHVCVCHLTIMSLCELLMQSCPLHNICCNCVFTDENFEFYEVISNIYYQPSAQAWNIEMHLLSAVIQVQ